MRPGPVWPRTLALLLAVALSVVVLFAPSPAGPSGFPHADKVVHALVFGLLTAAAVRRFGQARPVLLAAAAYAVGSELVQGMLLPGRQADPVDVLADLAGVLAVWRAAGLRRPLPGPGGSAVRRSRRRPRPRPSARHPRP